MSGSERASIDVRDPGFVCPVCGRTFDRDRQYCTSCGSNLVVRRDDDRVYDQILRMCGNPCAPPAASRAE